MGLIQELEAHLFSLRDQEEAAEEDAAPTPQQHATRLVNEASGKSPRPAAPQPVQAPEPRVMVPQQSAERKLRTRLAGMLAKEG